jgi:predicted CopG family antitoxin
LVCVSSALARPTTITVTERTRRLLEAIKGEGESFDELIQDVVEEAYLDDEFFREIQRRWDTEKRIPGREVMKRAGPS